MVLSAKLDCNGPYADVYLDIEELVLHERRDLYCMAMAKFLEPCWVVALILQRTGIEGQFRRVGLISLTVNDDNYDESCGTIYQSLLQPNIGQCPQYSCYGDGTSIYDIGVI